MILAVRADRVTFLVNAAHHGGKGAGHLADQEVGRFHALRSENVEDLVGIGSQRTVIFAPDQRSNMTISFAERWAVYAP